MTRRDEFLHAHSDFHPGMVAFSEDGEERGEVQKLDKDDPVVEKGERAGPMPGGETFRDDRIRTPAPEERTETSRRRSQAKWPGGRHRR